MKILAIETSGSVCSVALETPTFFGEYTVDGNNIHDELLAELVSRILDDSKTAISDLDAISLSAGPGSFTGLRIGAALCKGMCYGGSPKFIAVPTLKAYASEAISHAKDLKIDSIFTYLPSQKDFIFYQKFDLELNPQSEIEIDEIEKLDELAKGCYISANSTNKITAKTILNLAKLMYDDGHFADVESFEPSYIQEFKPNTSPKKRLII
ncbi:MAG: tRNA (adenosine(37)-N6)-threonylcarbamoyltransferase complex dimerization subunit type 1 TsaB [bacterium]